MVPRKLLVKTLLTTKTDRPIVSAVAVAAVRIGLADTESVARRPAVGEMRRSGAASTRRTGGMTNGEAIAMPANIPIVDPIPRRAATVDPVLPPPIQNLPPR